MSAVAIIPAGKARPISNGLLIADCPFHETGKQMLHLYPAPLVTRPFFFCFDCGNTARSPRTRTVHTSCTIAMLRAKRSKSPAFANQWALVRRSRARNSAPTLPKGGRRCVRSLTHFPRMRPGNARRSPATSPR